MTRVDTAIVRRVSSSIADCALSFIDRAPIDVDAARLEHFRYVQALVAAGITEVVDIEGGGDGEDFDEFPDGVFVEDCALVFDDVALITRPGAPSRRGETRRIAEALSAYREIVEMEAPATLDGGDVLRAGGLVFVGVTARSNPDGLAALARICGGLVPVVVNGALHLKSCVTAIDDETLLIDRAKVDADAFAGFDLVDVDADEDANALRVNDTTFVQRRPKKLPSQKKTTTLALPELAKAEGALTCCSLLFRR